MERYFPYPEMRTHQDEIIDLILTEGDKGKNIAFEAATGFGKTICVLSALLPLADKKGKKIIYCCRTHKQMDRVIDAFTAVGKTLGVIT